MQPEIIIEKENTQPVDAIHCNRTIEDYPAKIIIDSGSVSNIISFNYLKKINKKITKPSNINLIEINGTPERLLGEIINLSINIGNQPHTINALVLEKAEYDLLLGNIWAHNYEAILDWSGQQLSFVINNECHSALVSCTTRRSDTPPKSQPIIENEEEFEDEYEEDIPFEINIQDDEYEEEELLE